MPTLRSFQGVSIGIQSLLDRISRRLASGLEPVAFVILVLGSLSFVGSAFLVHFISFPQSHWLFVQKIAEFDAIE